jgi:tetratricopeptide (TPR) repeat protein
VLLVLDNVRSEEQVRPLVPGPGSASRVLVTSRHRLRLGGPVLTLDVLTATESATLLTGGCEPHSTDEAELVGRLAELSGHLPLALSLAAGRIARASGWQLADHLDRQQTLQAAHRLDAAVEASLQLSYAEVGEAAQQTLRTLSQLPGSTFDHESVAAVAEIDPEEAHVLLDRLARAHLVRPVREGHYDLHDVIRLFLGSRSLDEDPPRLRRSALDRLYAYQRAATAVALDRPNAEGTRWLERERANLLAGAFHALDHDRTDHAVALSRQLFTFLILNTYVDDATRLYERVAAATTGRERADALLALGAVNGSAGRLEGARRPLEQALTLYEEAGDEVGVAKVVHNLGALCWELGDYGAAGESYRRAASLAAEIEGPAGLAMTVDNLGTLHARQGRYAEARACHEQALAIHRRLQDRVKEGRTLNSLGLLALREGRTEPARTLLGTALGFALSAPDPIGELVARSRFAELDSLSGEHDRALDGLRQALAIGRNRSTTSEEMLEASVGLVAALRRSGRLTEASAAQDEAVALTRGAGDPYWRARAMAEGAALARASGDVDGARTAWAAASAEFHRLGCPEASQLT